MPNRSSDNLDNDHTDELPVLLETVALDEAPDSIFAAPRIEDTGKHVIFPEADGAIDAERLEALTAAAERLPALEERIGVLSENARELEHTIAAKDERIGALEGELSALRRARDDAAGAEPLEAQIALRDQELAELLTAVDGREQGAAEAAPLDADGSVAEPREPEGHAETPEVEKLREDYAALVSYVAGRRSWWDQLQATNTSLAARVDALERELKSGASRLATAETFAARESERAVALRAELVDYARRVDALGRELKLVRGLEAPPPAVAEEPRLPSAPVDSGKLAPSPAATGATAETPPVLTEAVDAVAPAVEAIAQLEAEVEYKRQQVAAQLVELRDREQRLRSAITELGTLRAQLDSSRSDVGRLEQTIAEKDRALAAREARIATLHEELKQRSGAVEQRSLADSLPPLETAALSSPNGHNGAAESASTPLLICLTGDAPRRFALTKRATTVGRGPQCDLQILTHFVSREHARLTLNGGATVIEDLGSRNGVFVNAVRVDRQPLRQGDLITIGETQFRFVESMAH
jgi:hypothetical protein